MAYEAKNFDHLLGTAGFSDTLLKNHFTLYQGYVKNVNTLKEKLSSMEAGTPEYNELCRRFGWEFNGMRLHELYFGNMSNGAKGSTDPEDALGKKLIAVYGSKEAWYKDFTAVGAMRGIGWAVLYYDPQGDELFNVWINEHDVGHLTGCVPLLVMDVFEHAFMTDYGLKRADYIQAFMQNTDWTVIAERFKNATK